METLGLITAVVAWLYLLLGPYILKRDLSKQAVTLNVLAVIIGCAIAVYWR